PRASRPTLVARKESRNLSSAVRAPREHRAIDTMAWPPDDRVHPERRIEWRTQQAGWMTPAIVPVTSQPPVRTAELPALASDLIFEHSPELRGTMENLTAPEKQMLEENFTEGLERWTSGASGWKIDVAGVRVGPTALFIPSLNLKNYDLEFLARVEAGGLT